MSDNEFEDLFSNLRSAEPSSKQIDAWKVAVQRTQMETRLSKPKNYSWMQLLAATIAGVILGAALMTTLNENHGSNYTAELDEEFATIEHVYTKSN